MAFFKKKNSCSFAKCFSAAAVLRYGIGILFLIAGLTKFKMGVANVADMTAQNYASSILPVVAAKYFMYALPFIEVILAAWLISGFIKKISLAVSGLLFLILLIGLMLNQQTATIAYQIFIYLLVTSVAMKMEEGKQ